MELKYLKNSTLKFLSKKESIEKCKSYYSKNDSESLVSFLESNKYKEFSYPIGIKVPDFELKIGGPETDVENAIIIHKNLSPYLKRVQSSDERLWSYLALFEFKEYMVNRWCRKRITEYSIRSRFLKGGKFFRQGIARLYWAAEFVYDDSLEDPYEHVADILSTQDLLEQVAGRSLHSNPFILGSVLKILREYGFENLNEPSIRLYFESLVKLGGAELLDAMDRKDLEILCQEALDSVINKVRVGSNSVLDLENISNHSKIQATVKKGKLLINKKAVTDYSPKSLSRLSEGKTLRIKDQEYRITNIKPK